MVNTTPYKGDYLWVNCDKEARIAQRHRHAILSHLQNSYQGWKRRADAKALGKSAKIPRELTFSYQIENDSTTNGTNRDASSLPEPRARRQAVNFRAQEFKNRVKGAGPLTILRKGNSDPFNTFAVPIDSKTNNMMNFFGTVMLPTVESGADWADSASFSYDWKNARYFLCDKMTALAHFTRVAIAMSPNETPTSSSDNIQALSYKTRSMALLRARITDDRIKEFNTYHATYLLLLAEAYARNFAAALVHASLLAHLLQSDRIQEGFQFVFRTFYYDYQRAAMSQTRLCFDIQHWIPKYFQPYWRRVMDRLPEHASIAEVSLGLDAIVDDADMHSIFVDIRQAHAVLVSSVEGTEYSSDEKSRYCRTFWTWIMARVHHRYLDAVEALEVMPPLLCSSWSTYLRVQAFFSLAAECYTRICVSVDATSFGRTTIFSANSVILAKLRKVLLKYEQNATPADILRYAKIQLWALFVGSYAEQVADLEFGGESAVYGWYNTRLARHVRNMGLVAWQDVREVLQDIHHFDGLQPHGSQWFWKTLNRTEEPIP